MPRMTHGNTVERRGGGGGGASGGAGAIDTTARAGSSGGAGRAMREPGLRELASVAAAATGGELERARVRAGGGAAGGGAAGGGAPSDGGSALCDQAANSTP